MSLNFGVTNEEQAALAVLNRSVPAEVAVSPAFREAKLALLAASRAAGSRHGGTSMFKRMVQLISPDATSEYAQIAFDRFVAAGKTAQPGITVTYTTKITRLEDDFEVRQLRPALDLILGECEQSLPDYRAAADALSAIRGYALAAIADTI